MTGWYPWLWLLPGDGVFLGSDWWRVTRKEGVWVEVEHPPTGVRHTAQIDLGAKVWTAPATYRPEGETRAAERAAVQLVQNVLGGRELSWSNERYG